MCVEPLVKNYDITVKALYRYHNVTTYMLQFLSQQLHNVLRINYTVTSCGSAIEFGISRLFWFIQVKLTNISCVRTLFKVQFKQDFILSRVWFKQL